MSSRDIQQHDDSTTILSIDQDQDFVSEFMYALSELLEGLPKDLPPLHESIDTDALEAIFGRSVPPNCQFECTLSFRMGMYMVHLDTQPGTGGQSTEGEVMVAVTSY